MAASLASETVGAAANTRFPRRKKLDMSQPSFQDAKREQNGILASAERQALQWMAARLPASFTQTI